MADHTAPTRHISISIERPADEVYEFARDPANLRSWAAGLGEAVENPNGTLTFAFDQGQATVEFVQNNPHGILDHTVNLPTGDSFYNPMRVIANGPGSEVIFTLFKLPGVTDDAFEADAAAIEQDLVTLKSLLER